MTLRSVYDKLSDDFIKEGIRDVDWADDMPELAQYINPAFKHNGGMGLMCGFATEITRAFTSVFLSERVLTALIESGARDAILLSHHPTSWDLRRGKVMCAPDETHIAALKERGISVYILHHPLDNYGPYSTCLTLAERLGISVEKPAFMYYGALCGLIGTTDCKTIGELREQCTLVMGHEVGLHAYGGDGIPGGRVAVCAGGGNDMDVAAEMINEGVRTLITGVTIVNDHTREVHAYERANRVNVLGCTHYSTEKFAMMAMCGYFDGMGLPCIFMEDEPDLYDL